MSNFMRVQLMVIKVGLVACLAGASTAYAGVTVGIGVGGIVDPLTSSETETTDSLYYSPYQEPNGPGWNAPSTDRKQSPGLGGRLSIPVRVSLSERVSLKITGDVGVSTTAGGVSWDYTAKEKGDACPASNCPSTGTYYGNTGVLFLGRVSVGAEYAFADEGFTPYLGAGVSGGGYSLYTSLGGKGDDFHNWESDTAMSRRPTCDSTDVEAKCADDSLVSGATFGGEVSLGMRTNGSTGFFAEVAYGAFATQTATPSATSDGAMVPFPSDVKILGVHHNPISLTVGLVFAL